MGQHHALFKLLQLYPADKALNPFPLSPGGKLLLVNIQAFLLFPLQDSLLNPLL